MNKIKNLAETVYRKKLLYRSKQRGWLEVDLILGSWATDNISKLSYLELKNYEKFLNKDTTEIYDLIIKVKLTCYLTAAPGIPPPGTAVTKDRFNKEFPHGRNSCFFLQ